MRGIALFCVLAGVPGLVGLFGASPALAKRVAPAAGVGVGGAPTPAVKAIAKRHFDEAQGLFNAGDYEKAMVEYQAAYAVWPLDGFNFNIAQCQRNLGHTAEAIDYFERYLKSPSSAKNRAEVEQVLAELRQKKAADEAVAASHALPASPPTPQSVVEAKPQPVVVETKPQPVVVETKPQPVVETKPQPEIASVTPSLPAQKGDEEHPFAVAEPKPVEPTPEVKPAVPAQAMAPTPEGDERPVYKRGWFWAATGAAFVVVGGAVTVAAVASQRLPAGSLGTADWR